MRKIWKKNTISRERKKYVLRNGGETDVVYGSEIFSSSQQERRKLEATEVMYLRNM